MGCDLKFWRLAELGKHEAYNNDQGRRNEREVWDHPRCDQHRDGNFNEIMRQLHLRLPFLKMVLSIPTYKNYLKDILSNKKSIEEGVMIISNGKEYIDFMESERQRSEVKVTDKVDVVPETKIVSFECNTIHPVTIPKKLNDPGRFVLPCMIGKFKFERCLCDLGASVSLMPLSVSKRLGITNFKPSGISLVLADRSVRFPIGLVENVHVRVGNFYIPTDFIVLELDEEPHDPLILGRPFLNTAGAIIDVRKSKINLQIGDHTLEFDMRETIENPMIGGQAFSIESTDDPGDKLASKEIGWSKVEEDSDVDTHSPTKKFKAQKGKAKLKRAKDDPHMILTPVKCIGDAIEYKVQCKGTSKPFSKVRAILTSELKEKGQKAVKGLLGRVLKLNMHGCGPCFGASFRAHIH